MAKSLATKLDNSDETDKFLETHKFPKLTQEKKKGTEKIFEEIIVENFPNMGKEIVNQVLEDRMVEFTAAEQTKEKRMKRNEDSLRDLWDNIKRNNIRIIGVPEGEEREKGPEKNI